MKTSILCIVICITLSSFSFGQRVSIDTLKVIQPKKVSGELIEYSYSDFSEPVYFNKIKVISMFRTVMNETTKDERFQTTDSTSFPFSVYLQLKNCIEFLQKNKNLTFDKEKTIGYPEELSIYDLTDRYLGEISCDLLDNGDFSFGANSMYRKMKVIKANVFESDRYSATESIKYFVNGEVICMCPPITHGDFAID